MCVFYEYLAFSWSFWSLWPLRSNQRHWMYFLSHLITLARGKNIKIYIFFFICLSGLWCGLQKFFLGLFHFCWDILSLLGCSNPIISISFQRVSGSNFPFPFIVRAARRLLTWNRERYKNIRKKAKLYNFSAVSICRSL